MMSWGQLCRLSSRLNTGLSRVYCRQVRRSSAQQFDAIIIGAGHNGLITASYLARGGLRVCVLEKRHVIGGAAVTEEIVEGFKFSRCSYVLSLMRPYIYEDLELKRHGLKVYHRDPSSYTPLIDPAPSGARSLILGRDAEANFRQIAQFSRKDAENFPRYEAWLDRVVSAVDPLLDQAPVNPKLATRGLSGLWRQRSSLAALAKMGKRLSGEAAEFYELITAPAMKVLEQWFESEPLKATLATDSVIGAMTSPYIAGSSYVLLHHVMGSLDGVKGAWGVPEGGMGGVSAALASSAREKGVVIRTEQDVSSVKVGGGGVVEGVVMADGTEMSAPLVLSNATASVTFLDLVPQKELPEDFLTSVRGIDYTSPVTKINVALSELPNFRADPHEGNMPRPHHRGTVHLNCEDSALIHDAYLDAEAGNYSSKPVIEMTLPSSLDPTIAPPGCHVALFFTQYTPYSLGGGRVWDEQTKTEYAELVFKTVEDYAPGFRCSVVGYEVLTPPDLERTFGLTGGNIFHGTMSLDQLYMTRPTPQHSGARTPLPGLYLCGSGAHPGGGVMGSPGVIAARTVLEDLARGTVKKAAS